MWRLTGFGDEISPDLEEQIAVLRGEGLRWIDVRSVWDRNIMTLTPDELRHIRDVLRAARVAVLCVGSPIGKAEVTAPFGPQLEQFRRALEIARILEAPYLRIFSFYIPQGDDPAGYRDEVIDRMRAFVSATEGAGITLLHENETRIYGDIPSRCFDLLHGVGSPLLRAIWDPGNFVASEVRPYSDGFAELRPYIAGLHVKDVVRATGEVVVAGAGDGQFPETLAALASSGWNGFCSFEPHLVSAGPFGGYSGPEGFRAAVRAFTRLLDERGIAWE